MRPAVARLDRATDAPMIQLRGPAIAAIVLGVSAVAAPRLGSVPAWVTASSAHFEVYTTGGDRRARETLTAFEEMCAFFSSHLQLAPPSGRKTRVIVFSNDREFKPYRLSDSNVGYYRPGLDRDFIVAEMAGADTMTILVHEYVHLIVGRSGARYPMWLNEGLAEFFSTVTFSGDLADIGAPHEGRVKDLERVRLLSLDELFTVRRDIEEYGSADHTRLLYAESWALTHMLLTSDRYRPGADRLMMMVRSGVPSAAAFDRVYGRSSKDVLRDLNDYIGAGHYPTQTVRFPKASSVTPLTTRAVDAFDATFTLAEMLASGRETREQARGVFVGLSKERPDFVPLLEARAAFELRSNQRDVARDLFARAVELGSTNVRTYRDYATLVERMNAREAEFLLQTALSLDPSHVRTRVRLASLVGRRSSVEALAILEPIADPAPEDVFSVHELRARAHLSLSQFELARTEAQLLTAAAASRQQRAVAARLVTSIDSRTSK